MEQNTMENPNIINSTEVAPQSSEGGEMQNDYPPSQGEETANDSAMQSEPAGEDNEHVFNVRNPEPVSEASHDNVETVSAGPIEVGDEPVVGGAEPIVGAEPVEMGTEPIVGAGPVEMNSEPAMGVPIEQSNLPESQELTGAMDGQAGAEQVAQGNVEARQNNPEMMAMIEDKYNRIKAVMINFVRGYYEDNHNKRPEDRDDSFPVVLSGIEDKIKGTVDEASSPDDFVQKIIDKLTEDEKNMIKSRIRADASSF